MVVTLGQQYNVGEKPTVMLYTYTIIIALQGFQESIDKRLEFGLQLNLLHWICMDVCMYPYSRVWINLVRLPILLVVS